MKLTTTLIRKITFQVYACWNEEGGMGEEYFGKEVDTLEEAVINLDLAQRRDENQDWFIKTTVTKIIK